MAYSFLSLPRYYIPQDSITVDELGKVERFTSDVDRLSTREAYERISVASTETLTDMAALVGQLVLEREQLAPDDIGAVIFCHHWEDEEWHRLHPFRLHSALRLPSHVEVLELRTGNSGTLIKAVDMAILMLRGEEVLQNILIIGSDKINRRLMPRRYRNQIFGDAAVGCIVSRRDLAFQIISRAMPTVFSSFNDLQVLDGQSEAAWMAEMQRAVGSSLPALLNATNIDRDSIAVVIVPNAGPSMLDRIASVTGISQQRIRAPSRSRVAHAATSDIFLNLSQVSESGELTTGMHILLLALGLGGSCHVMLLCATGAGY